MKSKPLPLEKQNVLFRLDSRSTKTGSVSRYAQIDSQHGVKLYRQKPVRDMCFLRQEKAYKLGLGPHCWHPFTIRLWGIKWFGFYTTHITVTSDPSDKLYRELCTQIGTHFPSGWQDLSYENVGYEGNRLVALDFSHIIDEFGSVFEMRPKWSKHACMERNKRIRKRVTIED